MKATARDLRFHAKEILESTMRGEEVIVTHRGKPAARIIPFAAESSAGAAMEKNGLFGIWKDKSFSDDVDGYIRKIRKGRVF